MGQTYERRSPNANSAAIKCERIENLPFDQTEIVVLEIVRWFILAFHVPERCAWMSAFQRSEVTFGKVEGALIAKSALDAVNAMRRVRRAGFNYCEPSSAECKVFITPDESCFISALHHARRGGRAPQSEAFQLCQGQDTSHFLNCLQILAGAIGRVGGTLH
ncbi:MAG: hypothetical protein AAF718_03975 [Pseudomonadota bacterium]